MGKATLLLAVFLLFTGCADASRIAEQEPREGLKHEYEAGVVRSVEPDLVVEGQYLSPEMTDLYFSYFRDGKYENPFTKEFLVFSVSIENKGTGRLSFDPRMAVLMSTTGAPMSSRDYTSIYAEFELAALDDVPGRMAAFRETCFDSHVTIAPGEKVQRLLVFTRDKDMEKDAALTLGGLYMDHKSSTVKLVFKDLLGKGERVPEKE